MITSYRFDNYEFTTLKIPAWAKYYLIRIEKNNNGSDIVVILFSGEPIESPQS